MKGVEDRSEGTVNRGVRAKRLLEWIPIQAARGVTDFPVLGVVVDSREIEPGFAFVAVKGERNDGNRFVEDAAARGACIVVSEVEPPPGSALPWIQTPDARKAAGILAAKVLGEPAGKLELVGVTGTNGKTTTAFLVDGLLSRLSPPSAMLGTVWMKLGSRSAPAEHTTPEAPRIQSFLRQAVDEGARFATLEVSSHGLALSRIEGTEFRIAVYTNLSRDHLEFHRDMETYFQAKRLLFTRYLSPSGAAVICIDDAYGERLAAELASRVVTYGLSATADLSIASVSMDIDGIRFTFRDGGRLRECRSPLLGRYNALNLLAAFAAVRALGFETEAVLPLLPELAGAAGRFEKVEIGRPFQVVVDYAHTDDALRKLLEAARELTRGKLWVVFGCGGERDRSKRPLMGDVAARLADRVVITSDNPRGEDPEAILREVQLGARGAQVWAEVDRRKAIEMALDGAAENDLVVIAGKGHESYQIIGDRRIPFDDRDVIREIAGVKS